MASSCLPRRVSIVQALLRRHLTWATWTEAAAATETEASPFMRIGVRHLLSSAPERQAESYVGSSNLRRCMSARAHAQSTHSLLLLAGYVSEEQAT